jgi:hypothetical protein
LDFWLQSIPSAQAFFAGFNERDRQQAASINSVYLQFAIFPNLLRPTAGKSVPLNASFSHANALLRYFSEISMIIVHLEAGAQNSRSPVTAQTLR